MFKKTSQDIGGSAPDQQRYLLERLLARACMASEGQSAGLDEVLGDLRHYLRGQERDSSRFKVFQENLDEQLELLDETRMSESRKLREALSRLLELQENLGQDRSAERVLRTLKDQLPRQVQDPEALRLWLEQFANLAEQALPRSVAGAEPAPSKGFLGRLFQRVKPDALSVPAQPMPMAAGNAIAGNMTAGGASPEEEPQRFIIARRVGELMEHILDQVQLPADTYRKASMLRSRLAESKDWDTLGRILEETAELVIATVSHGQREFEAFLQRLDERLASLQGHFSEQAEAQEGRLSASATLEASVREELVTIGNHMSEASDVDTLRQSVGQHLDAISQRLDGFRHQEQEREAILSGQLQTMQEKLAAMETHCEQVREKLREERQRALTDTLTELPNREAWDNRLKFEHDRWRRYGHPITLCVLDIDHFKQVNDSYGHKAGDKVLQLVARALQERLRTTDFVARYGGEEFVVLLPETPLEVAHTVIDDLRQHIAQLPFHFQGQPVNVTFSAGLSWFREGLDLDEVFDEADKALYRAKENGRNRIELLHQQATE